MSTLEELFGPPTAKDLKVRRIYRIIHASYRFWPWMRWPIMSLMVHFWTGLIEEGPVGLCKPRWGGLTFAYLNDGYKPTVFHTVLSLLGYNVMWPKGAPRNWDDLTEPPRDDPDATPDPSAFASAANGSSSASPGQIERWSQGHSTAANWTFTAGSTSTGDILP